jgi:hypothetical protein
MIFNRMLAAVEKAERLTESPPHYRVFDQECAIWHRISSC